MKKVASAFFVFGLCVCLRAQDAFFLNSNQSLLSLNPSFAGSNGGFRNQFSFRNQWPNLSGRYITFLNSADLYLSGIKAGIGATVMFDQFGLGEYSSKLYSFTYAQHLHFKGGQIKVIPSFQIGFGYRAIDVSQWGFREPYDYRYGYALDSSRIEKSYLDLNTGLLFSYLDKLYVGASIFHMNQPDVGFAGGQGLPQRVNLHVSYNLECNKNLRLQFSGLLNVQQDYYTTRLALNALFYDHLITGLACSNYDTAILSAGYRNSFFSMLVGYDVTISNLAGNATGSWELHASYNLRSKDLRRSVTSFETW